MNEFSSIHSITSIFNKQIERNVIIDPFSCLMKLSLLRFLDKGTKISISKNRIYFNTPSYIQGFVRFIYGDNREHLHNLYLPIQKCVEWFWDEKNLDITYMFNNAVIGLKMLKSAYSEYATIHHTIDYYIIIMMQKNTYLIGKIGITSLDIDKITKCIDTEISNPDTKIINNNINNEQLSDAKSDMKNTNTNTNTNTKNKHKNKSNELDISKEPSKEPSKDSKAMIDVKDIRDSILLQQEHEYEKQTIKQTQEQKTITHNTNTHMKDIHKFLFEIWNTREINIVINLYREMDSKPAGYERDNIYSNIMSYCSMKENKLYTYIESNSSIL